MNQIDPPHICNSRLSSYFQKIIQVLPYRFIFALWLLLAPLLVCFIWLQIIDWEQEQTESIIAQTVTALDMRQDQVTQDFASALTHLQGLPDFLAKESIVKHALQAPSDNTIIDAVNHYLENTATHLVVDLAFIINTNADCIASNNFHKKKLLSVLIIKIDSILRMQYKANMVVNTR